MNDEGALIKAALLTRTPLTTLIGTGSTARLWPYRSMPMAGYKPNDGIAIAFRTRGGGTPYQGGLMSPSVQFKVWGGVVDDPAPVKNGLGVLVDVLNNKSFGAIRMAYLEQLGQISQEQDTDWPFALAFFTIWLAM